LRSLLVKGLYRVTTVGAKPAIGMFVAERIEAILAAETALERGQETGPLAVS